MRSATRSGSRPGAKAVAAFLSPSRVHQRRSTTNSSRSWSCSNGEFESRSVARPRTLRYQLPHVVREEEQIETTRLLRYRHRGSPRHWYEAAQSARGRRGRLDPSPRPERLAESLWCHIPKTIACELCRSGSQPTVMLRAEMVPGQGVPGEGELGEGGAGCRAPC